MTHTIQRVRYYVVATKTLVFNATYPFRKTIGRKFVPYSLIKLQFIKMNRKESANKLVLSS